MEKYTTQWIASQDAKNADCALKALQSAASALRRIMSNTCQIEPVIKNIDKEINAIKSYSPMNRNDIIQTAVHIIGVVLVAAAIVALGLAFMWACYFAGIPM